MSSQSDFFTRFANQEAAFQYDQKTGKTRPTVEYAKYFDALVEETSDAATSETGSTTTNSYTAATDGGTPYAIEPPPVDLRFLDQDDFERYLPPPHLAENASPRQNRSIRRLQEQMSACLSNMNRIEQKLDRVIREFCKEKPT